MEGDCGVIRGADGKDRCYWCHAADDYSAYHDDEWGRPVADDVYLFEKICLDGFQSGLSWLTILRRRENFRRAFAGFDFHKVARFDDTDVERLIADPGIIRNRSKIASAINNARRAIDLVDEAGSIAAFFWRFEPDLSSRPKRIDRSSLAAMSATPASTALSKELKRRGWTFVGPTTMYSFMQSVGIVNDHIEGCFRRADVERERQSFRRPTSAGG